MKPLSRAAAVLVVLAATASMAQDAAIYRDRTRPIDERVHDLQLDEGTACQAHWAALLGRF